MLLCFFKKSAESLIHAFYIYNCSGLHHCNSLLYGLPNCSLIKLKRVPNACARFIFNEGRYCHITPLLVKLHLLPIQSRIVFKILVLTIKILNASPPSYLESLIYLKLNHATILDVLETPSCLSVQQAIAKRLIH